PVLDQRGRAARELRARRHRARRPTAPGLVMRWRQVAVLYAVAVLLAVDYFRLVAPPADATATTPHRARVFTIDVKQLSEIAIEHAGRRVVARRDGDGWTIEEPPALAVPSDLVQAFAVAVLEAEEIERVDGEHNLADYGLD